MRHAGWAVAVLLAGVVGCASWQKRPTNQESATKAAQDANTAAPERIPASTEQPSGGAAQGKGGHQLPESEIEWGSVADWAMVAVTFGALVAALINLQKLTRQIEHGKQAAEAATASTGIARRSMWLLNQPWLDTINWRVIGERRGPATPDGAGGQIRGELEGLIVGFDVVNKGPTPATIYEIEVRDMGSGSPPTDYSVTGHVGNVITPNAVYPYTANINNLSRRQIQSYEGNVGVALRIEGTIHFGDLFVRRDPNVSHGPRLRHFGRLCLLKNSGRSEFHPIAGAERVEPELGTDDAETPDN